jgi:hypothetical protein
VVKPTLLHNEWAKLFIFLHLQGKGRTYYLIKLSEKLFQQLASLSSASLRLAAPTLER